MPDFGLNGPRSGMAGWLSSVQALSEVNFDGVTVALTDGFADRSGHRQFVRTVSQRHEGPRERVPVYGAGHFDQPTGSKDPR